MVGGLTELDGCAQAELVRAGDISPLELVEAAVTALERIDEVLNVVVHPRYEQACAEAGALTRARNRRGGDRLRPFLGVPVLVKDLDGTTAGDPYHAGSEHLRRARVVARTDSHLQARLKAGGMIVLGRTNTPELGLLPTTEPRLHGPTRNPWHTSRSSGGSSGGSSAAVAARTVAIAHAGDGAGSLRIPASACGLVGLVPSRGRTSVGPDSGEAWGGFMRRHVVTRSVRDTAAVLDLVHGWAPGDPYTAPTPGRPFLDEVGADPGRRRIGVLGAPSAPDVRVHPDCQAALSRAAGLLEGAGHEVTALDGWFVPEPDQRVFAGHFATCFAVFAADEVAALGRLAGTPVTSETVEPLTWSLARAGQRVSARRYLHALDEVRRGSRLVSAWWEQGNDLLLTPTMPAPPAPLGALDPVDGDPRVALARAGALATFTAPFSVSGQPSISLPLHWNAEGLPVGVQLVAAYGREDVLLQVAAQLEAVQPWADRVPPVHA
jgi:amidase